ELVAICDRYENIIMIERDDDRITRVYDNKNNQISFKYNSSGVFQSITDARGRTTKLGYDKTDKSKLNKITYSDGNTLEWAYPNAIGSTI
ncbi:MAG: hypothetical protein OSJ68_10665, partial [Clostridia bacterium]|nr:hypothetical protein [Clostridia bacterium]